MAELRRNSLHLVFQGGVDRTLERFGEIKVTFELHETAFAELRAGLARIFRAFDNYQANLD